MKNLASIVAPVAPRCPTGPRRVAFIEALRKLGNIRAAARLVAGPDAIPERDGGDPCSAWHNLRQRDATFALEIDAALADFRASVHERVRAVAFGELEGEPIFYEGRQVGTKPPRVEGQVLLRLAEKHDRTWVQHKALEVSVSHDGNDEGYLAVRINELQLLDAQDKAALARICRSLRAIRAGSTIEHDAAPAIIEVTPEDEALSEDDARMLAEICA